MLSYDEKLGFSPSPHGPHVKIIDSIREGAKVLDVGCASGYLAKELRKKRCDVIGIEVNEHMGKVASKYCSKVILEDIEELKELPLSDGSVDYIIFADVLEHLRRPDLVLSKVKRYLSLNGLVIASIPNVARIEIRLKLFFGEFNYTNNGILSKGHLRFFTLQTAKQLFQSTGYDITRIDFTGLASKLKILPKLFAFQFVIFAQPSKEK